MQNAKDSFLVTLRDRLAVLNPARTVLVGGARRPAVIAVENELPNAERDPLDCFLLTWQEASIDTTEPLPLARMQCSIRYTTRGTAAMAEMDRGRVLGAMDTELRAMLLPASATKQNFTTNPATAMATEIFWAEPVFAAAQMQGDRVTRTVVVNVLALQEAGEA